MWKAAAKIDQWHAGANQLIAAHCEIPGSWVWVKNSGGADWVPRGPYKFIFMAVCAAATTNKNNPLIGNRALPDNQPRYWK